MRNRFSPLKTAGLASLAAALCTGHALAWTPKQAPIMTPFAKDVDPAHTLPEYPRPQMERKDWLNLNGVWEYQPGEAADATPTGKKLASEILVPFPVESALSGVMEHHERLWYRRTFTVPKEWNGQRALLHFGAVDWETEVFVNGKSLGVHKGGYDPFSFDITKALKEGDGEQELIVRVYDPTDDFGQPRGKQTLHQGGIMYTPTTGIWQTVWLEPVAELAILDLKLVPDVDDETLHLTATTNTPKLGDEVVGTEVKVAVKDGDKTVAAFSGPSDTELDIPIPDAKLWSPDSPFLYDLEVSLVQDGKEIDRVKSYFGMRKIEIAEENGVKKMMLNGKFVFEFGPLDQGFWPDGIYTQPTEAALKYDIEMMKRYGFNMVRKHIKVEPARWYYWTDKLGLMVWQDMPSADSYIDTKKYPAPPVNNEAFKTELQRMVETHWNVPSIIMWDIFNESQSQHDTVQLVGMVKKLDPTRLVNEASGGSYHGAGDVYDEHHYPPPACPKPNEWQAIACGEYGGIGYNVPDHTWTGKGGGYTDVHDPEDLLSLYAEYANLVKDFRDKNGLSAVVYTQLTDVETEINGLMTYDRVSKVDPALIAKATHFEYPNPTYQEVVPTSEKTAQTWHYTTDAVQGNAWEKEAFDDSAWPEGTAGFGNAADVQGNTAWTTGDIWIRRHFNPGELTPEQIDRLMVRDFHDEDVQVYINGVQAYASRGFITAYEYTNVSAAAKKAIKPNADNVLAVHCHQTEGGQFIDVGLSVRKDPVPAP